MAKQLNVNMKFTADTSEAKAQIASLQSSLKDIAKMPGNASNLFDDTQIKKASKAALELQSHLQKAVNVDTGKLDLSRFASSLKTSNRDLATYANTLLSTGKQGQQAFLQLANAIATADTPVTRINNKLSDLGTTLKNTAKWQISSSVLHGFMGAVQSAYGYAQDLNSSLNDIRIVTGQNIDQMARFAETANRAAKALSTTTTDYTKASLIYYQQGLDESQVKERTDVTIKMANVAGQSAQIVSDQMTAVWNNFDNGSKSLEYYADVMTALGAATASSTDEIAQGLEKFAAISETVGLSYEYATAALATVTDKTRQSADVVGTAFKTMFARIQGLELGETLEDGTNLNDYSEALSKVGVNIKDANGNLKDMDNILSEMAGVWETLNRDEQVALAQKVAGVRQYSQLMALMENWDAMEINLGVAEGAEGSLQEQADIYAESWEAAQDRVRAAAEGIYQDLIDDEFFIDILNGFEKLLEGVDGFVSGLGGMKGVISVVGSMLLTAFAQKMPEALENAKQNLMVFTGQSKKAMSDMQSELNITLAEQQANPQLSDSFKIQLEGISKVNEMKQKLVIASKNLTSQEKAEYEAKIQNVGAMYEEIAALAEKKKVADELAQRTQKTAERGATSKVNKVVKDYGDSEEKVSSLEEKATDPTKSSEQSIAYAEKLEEARKKAVELELAIDQIGEAAGLTKDEMEALGGAKGPEEQAKAQEKVAQKIKETSNAFTEQIKQRSNLEELSNSVISQGKAWENVAKKIKEAADAGNGKNLSKAVDSTKEKMQQYLQVLQKVAKENGIALDPTKISELASQINGMDANNIDEITNKFSVFAEEVSGTAKTAIETLDTSIEDLRNDMSNLQFDEGEIKEMENGAEQAATANRDLANSMDTVGGMADENMEGTFKMSVALTEFASVAMSVSGLITSLKSAISTMTDEGASGFEKFGAAISVIMPLMSTFNAIQSFATTLSKNAAIADWAKAKATTAAASAKLAENAAWLASPITWIIGAILGAVAALGLLVAGITAVTKALIDGYNADAIAAEKAAETAKELGDMYDQAASKYQNMIDTMSQYEEAQKSLDQLTKGTEEYTEALNEANRAALELIQNNPGQFEEGKDYNWEDGQLKINKDALDSAKQTVADQESAAYAAKQFGSAKADVAQAKSDQTDLTRQIQDDLGVGLGDQFWKGLLSGGATTDILSDLAGDYASTVNEAMEKYQTDPNLFTNKEYMAEQLNIDPDGELANKLFELQGPLTQLGETTKEAANSYKLATEAAVRELLGDNKTVQDSENKDEVVSRSADVMGAAYEAEFAKLANWGEDKDDQSDAWKEYAEQAGLDKSTFVGTSETEDGRILYEYLDAEGESKKVSLDAMKELVATSKANESTDAVATKLTQVADFLDSAISNLEESGETNSALAAEGAKAAVLGGDFSGFSGDELSALSSMDPAAYAEQMFGPDWESKLIELGFANAEEYMKSFSEGVASAQDIYNNALASLGENSPLSDLAQGASAAAVQNMANQATNAESVKEGYGDQFQSNIDSIIGTVDVENQGAAFEALANIDWSQLGASEEAINALGKLGISSEETEKKIIELKTSMRELNGVDLNDLNTALDADVDTAEYEALASHLQEVAKASEDFSDDLAYNESASKKTAEAILRFDKAIQKVNDNYDDWAHTMESGSIQDQAKMVGELKDAYADMLDIDMDSLSDDFVMNADNLDLMKQAAEGSEEAYAALQEAAGKDILASIGLDKSQYDADLQSILNQKADIEGNGLADLEAGASLDNTDFLNSLTEMVNEAGMTAQEATDYLASMGIDAEVVEDEATTTDTSNFGGAAPVFEWKERTFNIPILGEQTIKVPTINWEAFTVPSSSEKTTTATGIKVKSATKSSGGNIKHKHTTSGGGTGGSKGGSSGGSKGGDSGSSSSAPKTKKPTEKSDIIERYKEITDSLDDNTKALDKANKAADRLFGPAKIKALDQANKLLVEQNELLQQQYDEAEEYLSQDKSDLQSAAGELGVSFSFDQDGDISNYTSVMETLYAQLAAAEETYNNLSTGEEQQEYEDSTLGPLQEKINKIKELVGQYEDTKETLEGIGDQIEENQLQIDSNHSQMINYVVEVKTEAAEAKLEYIDYLMEKLEHSGYNAAKAIEYMGSQVSELGKVADAAQEGIDRLYKKNEGKDITEWSAEDLESLKNYKDQLLDVNKQLMETRQAVEDTLMQAFDEWREGYQEEIEKFDHFDSVYESYSNITDLMGKSSGVSKEEKKQYNQNRADNANRKLASSKTYYDEVGEKVQKGKDELAAAQERMNSAEKGSAAYEAAKKDIETWKKYIEEAEDELVAAEEAYLADWEAALEAGKEAFLSNAKLEIEALEESIAGVYGSFEAMQETFDRNSEVDDRYLEGYEKLYELNKLSRDLENEIDNTSNIQAKEKLLKIQEKINQYQAEGVEMSQYDLEYLQKEYELELAKIAMEEAQNAKSQVRMTRDAEGNFSYTYTADEEQAGDAAQNYEDKLYEMTELNNQYVEEQTAQILSAQQELTDQLTALTEQAAAEMWTEEQLAAKAAETQAYYTSLISYYGSEIDKASLNNTVVYAREYETYAGYVGEMITEAQKLEAAQKAVMVEQQADVERLRIQQEAANAHLNYLHEADLISTEEYMAKKAETNQVYVEQITTQAVEAETMSKEALQVLYENDLISQKEYTTQRAEVIVANNTEIALANMTARDEELLAAQAGYEAGLLSEKEYLAKKKEISNTYQDEIDAANAIANETEQKYLGDQYAARMAELEAAKLAEKEQLYKEYEEQLAELQRAKTEELEYRKEVLNQQLADLNAAQQAEKDALKADYEEKKEALKAAKNEEKETVKNDYAEKQKALDDYKKSEEERLAKAYKDGKLSEEQYKLELQKVEKSHKEKTKELKTDEKNALKKIDDEYKQKEKKAKEEYNAQVDKVDDEYSKKKKEAKTQYQKDVKKINDDYATKEKQAKEQLNKDVKGLDDKYSANSKTALENRTKTTQSETANQIAAEKGVATSFNKLLPGLKTDHSTASGYAKTLATDVSKAIGSSNGKGGGSGILGSYAAMKKDTEDSMKAAGTSTEDFGKTVKKALVGSDGKGGINQQSKDTKTSIEKMANTTKDKLDKAISAVSDWQKTHGVEAEKVIQKNEKTVKSINKILEKIAKLTDKEYTLTYTYKTNGKEPTGKDQKYTITYDYQTTGNPPDDSKPQGNGKIEVGDQVSCPKYIYEDSSGRGKTTTSYSGKTLTIQSINGDYVHLGTSKDFNSKSTWVGWAKKSDISGYDTGGYTGTWGMDGKLAFLHEKELVLNASDTENMLSAVSVIRDIVKMIDLQAYQAQMNQLISSPGYSNYNSSKENIEQYIEIHAEFPDATNHREIEEAFDNLRNLASQYVNRK